MFENENDTNEGAAVVESPEYAGKIEATSTTLQSFVNIDNASVEMSQSFVKLSQEASQEVSSMDSSDVVIEEIDEITEECERNERIKESGFLSSQESSQETKTVSAVSECEVEDASGKTFLTQQMAESKLDDENAETSNTESGVIDSSKTESGMATGDDEDMDLRLSDDEIERPETQTDKLVRASSISKDIVGSPVAKRLLRGSSVPKTIPLSVEITPARLRTRRQSQLDKIEEDSPLPSPARHLRGRNRLDSQDSDSGNLSTPSAVKKRTRSGSEAPETPTRMTRRRSSQLEDPPSTPSRSTRGKSADVDNTVITPRRSTRRSVARDSPDRDDRSTPIRNLRRSVARDSPEKEHRSTPVRNLRRSVARDSPEKEQIATPIKSSRRSVARGSPENLVTPVKSLRRHSTSRDTPERTTKIMSVSREEIKSTETSQNKESYQSQKPETSRQTRARTKSIESPPKTEEPALVSRRMTRTQLAKAAEIEAKIKGASKRTSKILDTKDLGEEDLSDADSTSSKASLRSNQSTTRKSSRRTKKVSF